MVTNKLTITYDEADIVPEALRSARSAAISALMARGVSDLNSMSSDDFDHMLAVFLLCYQSRVVRDQFAGPVANIVACVSGQEISVP